MRQQAFYVKVLLRFSARFGVEPRLTFVRADLFFELRDLLARVTQRVGFSIERFHAMATDAAALIEQVLRQIQRVRTLRHTIVRVTHLATGFSVLFMK